MAAICKGVGLALKVSPVVYICRLEGAEFPVQLLPKVTHAPCIAGALRGNWYGIPEGTLLGIAMGDLQCSILAAHPTHTDAGICQYAVKIHVVNHISVLKCMLSTKLQAF